MTHEWLKPTIWTSRMKTKDKINMCLASDEYFNVQWPWNHGFLVVVPSIKLHVINIDLETYM